MLEQLLAVLNFYKINILKQRSYLCRSKKNLGYQTYLIANFREMLNLNVK